MADYEGAVGVCQIPGCWCGGNWVKWSPWALEVLHTCRAEGRKATEEEAMVLCIDLSMKIERCLDALSDVP